MALRVEIVQKNQYVIECNDEGAEYMEARVLCDMASVTKHPKLDHLRMLLPYNPHQLSLQNQLSIDQVVLLAVQVNRFLCGGIAIGVCIRHVIADAAATATFFKTWATINASSYKNDTEYVPRNYVFDCTSLFPPQDVALAFSARASKHNQIIHKTVTKRFILSDTIIAYLRKKCSMDDDGVNHPTRVEAVVAFLWTMIIQSSRKRLKRHEILLTVNLRKRMVPSIPPHCIGNVFQPSRAQWEADVEKIVDFKVLTKKLVNEVRKMKDEYIRNIFENGDFLKGMKERLKMVSNKSEEMGTFAVSSWCRFPFYETDFGFGKPSWYGSSLNYINSAILMDTSDGKGMEAWITLKEEDMEKLEQNSEFLSYFTSILSQSV
ncbi:putative 3'-N-debenzoyl-2'-deoxytaxol N-benzoyltransferase [Heracleum sosnowskyi]|uniref:3'-N-debenzoyl-2'-deoxytaxol N-benzoyltransferase n=1 Tax=Heracleum sosnowskyi TaxID=360622 RepID=A0AAD8HL48_9APIA|nr:putative 3'-N-debenzoyl-2'-deoxytaxol N-benzoyltransferase [Heracleum sosnowskyi]